MLNPYKNFSMSISATIPQEDPAAQATSHAASHLWQQILRARQQRDDAASTIDKFAQALTMLMPALPQAAQEEYRRKLDELKRESPADLQRVGEVSGNVIELFRREVKKEWNVSEVQNSLSNQGKSAEPKAIYNTLNYLVKAGLLERVARGRYRLRELGFGLEADGLPDDGTTRMSEHY